MRVSLPAALAVAIFAQADAAHPQECCGLLEGAHDGDAFRITALHPARNLSSRPDRFEIDPVDHLKAQKTARASGHGIIGCYHSHPHGAAQPSETDLAGAEQDNFLWLIVSDRELNAFVYRDGVFRGCMTGAD